MGTGAMQQLACRVGATQEGLGVRMGAHAWRGSRATQKRAGAGLAWERAGQQAWTRWCWATCRELGMLACCCVFGLTYMLGLVWSRKLGLRWA